MKKTVKLSIVIPAYNESTRIGSTLSLIHEYLATQYLDFEMRVVNDGSSDNTREIITEYAREKQEIRLVDHTENHGKGRAIRSGLAEAAGDIIIFLDADLAVPVFEIENMVTAVQGGADMAIGARYQDESIKKLKRTPLRNILSRGFNLLTRGITGLTYRDTQCGLKAMTRDTAERIVQLSDFDTFGFDVEWLWIMRCLNKRVVEVPVSYTDVKGSKIHVLRTSFLMFLDIVRLGVRRRGRYYEKRI